MYGAFRNKLPPQVRDRVYAATKWCVFGPVAQPITEEFVLDAVRERCRRLGGRVELLQFHWYDVSYPLVLSLLSHSAPCQQRTHEKR